MTSLNYSYLLININLHFETNFCATYGPTFFSVWYKRNVFVSEENLNLLCWQVFCRSIMPERHATLASLISTSIINVQIFVHQNVFNRWILSSPPFLAISLHRHSFLSSEKARIWMFRGHISADVIYWTILIGQLFDTSGRRVLFVSKIFVGS